MSYLLQTKSENIEANVVVSECKSLIKFYVIIFTYYFGRNTPKHPNTQNTALVTALGTATSPSVTPFQPALPPTVESGLRHCFNVYE